MNNICKEYSKCGEGVFISSDKGWIPVEYVMKTVPFEKYIVLFESGNELECADRHALINKNHNTITADELKIGDEIICEYGVDKVFDVFATGQYEEMYDVSLKDYHHYYANGILSHNSTFLANLCARQVMMGKNIVLASLEMSEDAFSQRFDSIFSLLDINRIYREKSMKLKLIKKLGELKAQEGRGNLYIKQYPTGKATVDDYRRYIRELRIRGIVIHEFVCDYLNLMKSQYKTKGDMYSDVKNISEELRAMSYEFKIPVVSVSQLNREGMNITFDEVDFTYISESIGVAATADLVAIFGSGEDKAVYESELFYKIVKNRLGGRVGVVDKFFYDQRNLKMYDSSEVDQWFEDAAVSTDTRKMAEVQADPVQQSRGRRSRR